jgi:rhamnose transport system ATP-binding protein
VTSPLLQLSSVTKAFGAVRALKGVSFDLQPGEVHALLGENGAGKSTLIKLITGAHAPDTGTIEVDGRLIRHLTPAAAHRLGIACIYQQPALFPDLTVAENIGLRLEPTSPGRRIRWEDRRRRSRALLTEIGAAIPVEAEVRSLSMPEQQLVEIACVVGAGARVVIMDEPTASLTRREQERLFSVVRDLRSRGVGIIYISHRLEEIFRLADRLTVLRDGETVGTRAVAPLPSARGIGSPSVQESELIQMMVGREVSHIFPPSEAAAGPVVLSLRGVQCHASRVRDIDLDIHAGEIIGLAGLVGAGRTELARVLFGITPADAGEIRLNGERLEIRSPRQAVEAGIAYVPEDRRRHGVILEMPIAHNTTLAVLRQLFPRGWMNDRTERDVTESFIRDLDIRSSGPEALAGSLSGGNQQKVSLARWLAIRPRLLILDEPTQGVDVGAKSELHRIIRRLASEGLAVLMISSDLPEILGMSDRIAVMRGGTISTVLPGTSDAHVVMAAALGQQGAST